MKTVHVCFKKPYYRWLFGGMGFHNSEATMTPLMTDGFLQERILKSYREISPTFSRVFAGFHDWTKEAMDAFAEYYHATFAQNDCTLYAVPGRLPRYIYDSDERAREFAENVAVRLKYLIEEKDCRLIRYYCISNEMSVGNQYALYVKEDALEKFKRHHEMLYEAFRRHGLHSVGLIATDTSGIRYHDTVKWAVENMDEITDTYCTHNYATGGYDPMSADFSTDYFPAFHDAMAEMVQLARTKEKRYILGEYGLHYQNPPMDVMRPDVPFGFGDEEKEAFMGLAVSAKSLTAMNAGVFATAYWTFADYPDPFISDNGHSALSEARHAVARFSGHGTSVRYNKHGLFCWSEEGDFSARAYMYSLGLMIKFFKKNARVLAAESDHSGILCGGVTNPGGSVSLCLINLTDEPRCIEITSEHKADKPYRLYEYDSQNVPKNDFGDLQGHSGLTEPDGDGVIRITLKGKSMQILTTDYVDRTPAEIRNISVLPNRITWDACTDREHCYYRVYRDGVQIGSTVAEYLDRKTNPDSHYTVRSVDRYGNV